MLTRLATWVDNNENHLEGEKKLQTSAQSAGTERVRATLAACKDRFMFARGYW